MKREPIFDFFEKLITTPSPPGREERVISYLKGVLPLLGCKIAYVGQGGIIAYLEATDSNYPPLFFNAHLDAHTEKGIEMQLKPCGTYYQAKKGNLGADDKAGVAAILAMIKEIQEINPPHGLIEFIFSTQEELGMKGIQMLDLSLMKSQFGYTIDAPSAVGTFKRQSETHLVIEFCVTQSFLKSKFSPIQVARDAIHTYHREQFPEGFTVTVEEFAGETTPNGTEQLKVKLCITSALQTELTLHYVEKIKRHFHIAGKKCGANTEVSIKSTYQGYHIPQDHHVLLLLKQAAKKQKLIAREFFISGGSDANVLNERGFTTLLIGAGYENAHTSDERITQTSLLHLYRLLYQIAICARGLGTLSSLAKNK